LLGCQGDAILDAWIFASKAGADGVWVRGRKLVTNGRHNQRDQLAARFGKVMTALAG
jgi:hypothetical protein